VSVPLVARRQVPLLAAVEALVRVL
jgi:hypothetical protein